VLRVPRVSDMPDEASLERDDPAVRRLTCKALERAGYQVLRASDGLEALGLITALGEYVDLLITDVVMPRMGGRELARELRIRYENLPVLYISGYPREDSEGTPAVRGEYLQKPFTGSQLLRAVAGIVQSNRAAPD
jgi:two-component system cell cycle sensor histidine kinase/response regulator CckA